jgi:hypothetical protein
MMLTEKTRIVSSKELQRKRQTSNSIRIMEVIPEVISDLI